MKQFAVNFQPDAIAHLEDLENYLGNVASPDFAAGYVGAIIEFCFRLSEFPNRGTLRDEVRPGLRSISYRSKTIIVFIVEPGRVEILGVFHGGQNWESRITG